MRALSTYELEVECRHRVAIDHDRHRFATVAVPQPVAEGAAPPEGRSSDGDPRQAILDA
jgi:hypothetical protein